MKLRQDIEQLILLIYSQEDILLDITAMFTPLYLIQMPLKLLKKLVMFLMQNYLQD